MKPLPAAVLVALAFSQFPAEPRLARAADPADSGAAGGASDTPYIDSLKARLGNPPAPQQSSDTPYIDSLRQKQQTPAQGSEGYTDRLKQKLAPGNPTEGYTDQQKAKLGAGDQTSAIQNVKEGHSALKARMEGSIHNAFGFRFGLDEITQSTTAASSLQSFGSIYSGFPIDLDIFYEYQPWHSELVGEIGFFGESGVGFYQGHGNYQFPVHNADGGGNYSGQSPTAFNFIAVPITVGVDFRLNTAKYFRPFAMAGGTAAFFYEDRNDGGVTHMAYGLGFYAAAGLNILMDWVSPDAAWELYAGYGVLHYYLTLQYSFVMTPSGPVDYSTSGPFAGFTFEF